MKSRKEHSATHRTVIIAGAANIVVGLAKLAAGIISGSSAMLAEAAHSAADTLNQVFLLTSLRQAERPADRDHPFGHGQDRYFWSLLAAFGIFIAGGGFSIFEGLLSLGRSHNENPLFAYVTLAVAFIAEGTSFARALWQVRGEARRSREDVLHHVESSPDITVKVTLFEDSAAVVGLALAALGVGLSQLTGSSVWDGAASIAIGVLLVVVAIKLAMDSRELLIGRAADPAVQQLIREEIESRPGVDALLELRTMHMGPDSLIVAARVALNDDMGADQTEDLADEIDRRLSERLPQQLNVFIDPTQTRQTPQPEAALSPGRDAVGTRTTPLGALLGRLAVAAGERYGRRVKQHVRFCSATDGVRLAGPDTQPIPPIAVARLSGRELEVLELVSEGLTNEAIADRLCLSVRTVERPGSERPSWLTGSTRWAGPRRLMLSPVRPLRKRIRPSRQARPSLTA